MRIGDLEGIKEGDRVVVGIENYLSTNSPTEIFLGQGSRENPCFFNPFGAVLTLAREVNPPAIRETAYLFTVERVIGSGKSVIRYEEGTPRFGYYDAVLKRVQL